MGGKRPLKSKSDPTRPRQHHRQKSRIRIMENLANEAKLQLSENLSFCGCGFLGIYHVGVASCFHEYAPQLSMHKISGSSAGALVAVAHICGNLQLAYATTDILRVAIDARASALGPFHPSFDINATVRDALERGLPDDVHMRADGKLHISLTRLYDGENVIVSKFESKEDVIQALICSCFIPFWSGLVAPKYKGVTYIDGGFSNNLIILDDKTVTVSPFAGEADICPQDDAYNVLSISLSNTSFSLTPHNLYRLSHALLPPPPEVLSELCEQGFADAIRFLQRLNLISCNRCLEIRSSLILEDETEQYVGQTFSYCNNSSYDDHINAGSKSHETTSTTEEYTEEDYDCDGCVLRRKTASLDPMPKQFTDRIRQAQIPKMRFFRIVSSSIGHCKERFKQLFSLLIVILAVVPGPSQQQSSISLNSEQWFVSNANRSIRVPAQVPGGIYSDLRRNNVLKQDLLYGKNDMNYRWVGNENWTYSTVFSIDHQVARSQSVKLVLHGVDTVSKIDLNGHEIGSTDNMFVRYKFDIKPHLKLAGLPNVLMIKFESPVKYSARKSHQSIRNNRGKIIPPYCPSPAQRGECHVNFIRKMQASFSWDWGPAFPSVGLYKDIDIEFGSFGIIRDILVDTRRLPPLISQPSSTTPAPQVIISSSIRQQVKTPNLNKTVPYIRAPPYYVSISNDNQHLVDQFQDITSQSDVSLQLLEENWLLKITLVAEMVQPSFGYNLRVEFNLNEVLHYESEHINVVANSDGIIRLGFNLRIDSSRMRVRPWWPNNAGSQTLYKLTTRMMPIPNPANPPDRVRLNTGDMITARDIVHISGRTIRIRERPPPQTPAISSMMVLMSTPNDANSYHMQHVSEMNISFGFRTVELIQEPVTRGNLDDGLTFHFRVNGVDLFAMGSNWIPASVFPEYNNDLEYIKYLLQSAKDANMNMLRVWGGGLYESDEFYKMADKMGIMIWHDFMFACALYPAEDDFLASVRLEIEQQVQRLQYHPSIVLWAGNNENEMAIAGPWWPEVMMWNKKLKENYAKLYVETIKPIVQILDPTRPYIESSPTNGLMSQSQPNAIARVPNDNKYGDVHHYDYLSDSFDWTNYPSTRFASEYGFQSYPSFDALASVTTANDWKYPLSSNVLHRQHRITGETEMKIQIKMHFNDLEQGGVDKFKNFIYISQLTQAIAIKTETEFYRRNRFIDPETKLGKTMGALYWQLNDVWQAPTWSSIEYGGKWKMLHYFARRFFFPIQVMPYIIQATQQPGIIQQVLATGSNLLPTNPFHRQPAPQSQQQSQDYQQPQQQSTSGSLFVVDLVRDDLFYLLDSFNVTIRFYRWTSFTPVWQDTVYVKHARPQNVTRIYEQEMARIIRQPSVVSLSSGVFQVLIEQQPRLGLSQIDNYLMPVIPSRVTAMRVAKISIELIQGPFELTEVRTPDTQNDSGSSSQWSCAYRLTLVSDAIAMFVWLDLNLLNIAKFHNSNESPPFSLTNIDAPQAADQPRRPPENIHLDALPPHFQSPPVPPSMNEPPEHIRLQMNGDQVGRQEENLSPGLTLSSAGHPQPVTATRQARQIGRSSDQPNGRQNNNKHQQHSTFRPLPDSGSNMLRYQFSDNAFNMFEPSKVIDLYLNRCLSKADIDVGLEIRSMADSL